MAIVGIFWWWYGAGWRQTALRVIDTLKGLFDYFSLDLLVKTLFSPFRQISAGTVDGPIGVKLRAFFDRLLSRVIGSIVRSIVLVIGIVTLALGAVVGIIYLLLWALLPIAPLAGLTLALAGWMPWS